MRRHRTAGHVPSTGSWFTKVPKMTFRIKDYPSWRTVQRKPSGDRSQAWLQFLHILGRTAFNFAVECGESAIAAGVPAGGTGLPAAAVEKEAEGAQAKGST
jgi:hypothetical protein